MKRLMFIDCFSGVAGDMLLGALLDAGLPEAALRDALGSLGVDHELRVSKVVRCGLSATKVDVVSLSGSGRGNTTKPSSVHGHHHDDEQDPHAHPHTHGVDAHRSLADIARLVERANLSASARGRAIALFTRLAEVEAGIHNMPVDKVHLHEVGALDSIVDIVGCVFGLEWFGASSIVASPLNLGSGTVTIAHGTFPVPAPATLRLAEGIPVYSDGPTTELTTPTGALLVAGHATGFGTMPSMVVEAIGYGAGTKDFPDRPNVVRVVIGHEHARPEELGRDREQIVKIECEVDDMNPQLFGVVVDELLGCGARDVFLTPVQMKKQRPGTLLTVIAAVEDRERLSTLLFTHTTTIGVRYELMWRDTLERRFDTIRTAVGEIRMKVALRDGRVLNVAPEFEDCVRAAKASGTPLKFVQAEAMKVWLDGSKDRRGQ